MKRFPLGLRDTLFFFFIAVVPLLYIQGFGIWYREPKIVGFWIGASFLAWSFAKEKKSRPLGEFRPFVWAASLYLLLSLASIFTTINSGLALERTMNLGGAILCCMYVYHHRTSAKHIALAVCCSVVFVVTTNLLRNFFGMILFPLGGGLGSVIGERNPCAIYLAAAFPFVLALFADAWVLGKRQLAIVYGLIMQGAVISIMLARCRNAWWMIFVYGVVLASFSLRRSTARVAGVSLLALAVTVLTGIATISYAPSHLQWRSSQPYWDSFITMASAEKSNGRLDFWAVGVTMAQANLLWGIGAGNAIIVMRDYVAASGVNPKVFAFLRNDLPLFNDYLQAFAENGILGGLAFFVFILYFPVVAFMRGIDGNKEEGCVFTLAAYLVVVGVAFSCIFEYTLVRVEGLLLYSVAQGLLLTAYGGRGEITAARGSGSRILLRGVCFAYLLSVVVYAGSFSLRRWGNSVEATTLAWKLWPFDNQWNEEFAIALLRAGDRRTLDDYLSSRKRTWPFEPRSHLAAALVAKEYRDFNLALQEFKRGLHEVPGGRCNWYTWTAMDEFWKRTDIDRKISDAARDPLYSCSQ